MKVSVLSARKMRVSVSAITFCACGVATPALAVDCFDALLQPDSHEMCNLGLLEPGSPAESWAGYISDDGSTLAGYSSANHIGNSFYWSSGDPSLNALPGLTGPNSGMSIFALSGDGTTIVGHAYPDPYTLSAVVWTEGTGTVGLGTLRADDTGNSTATAVSFDGSVVVGSASTDSAWHAFRWTSDGGMQDLGSFANLETDRSEAHDVSSDGSTVVGMSLISSMVYRAFIWRDDGNGLVDLGQFGTNPLHSTAAYATSSDGTAVAGVVWSNYDDDIRRVFYWQEGDTGLTDLGTLREDDLYYADFRGLSDDGTTVIGFASTEDNIGGAFRWRNDGSGMINLGHLGYVDFPYSEAYAVSADGSAVVGFSLNPSGQSRAYIWRDDGNGMQDLGTLRPDQTGHSEAWGISADGTTVVGRAQFDETSEFRAFIWHTKMQDLENVVLSFPVQAADTEIAFADQEHLVGSLLGQRCEAAPGKRCAATSGLVVARGGDAAGGVGAGRATAVRQSFGFGLDGQIGFGGSVLFGDSSADNSLVDPASARAASLWATSSIGENGGQLSFAAAFGASSATFYRGDKLENVMVGEGVADLTTNALRIAYGLPVGAIGGWSLRSEASLDYVQSVRSAYSETGSDFNADYDEAGMDRTTLGLDVEGSTLFAGGDRLRLGFGIETDLEFSGVGISGTTDLQGMETFDVQSPLQRRGTRGSASLGFDHALADGKWLSLDLGASQSPYGDALTLGAGLQLRIVF